MATITAAELMTTEDLLALPEDGVERELIRGELRTRPMTRRNPRHSWIQINVGTALKVWLLQQPEPRGLILGGEAGFRLRRDPDSTVGIDVAYISAELSASTPKDARLVEGIPILAVEILSPSDTQEEITDKILEYLDVGVLLVWIFEPVFRTVTVYRPDAEPVLFNVQQELSSEPHLPGFRVPVTDLFSK